MLSTEEKNKILEGSKNTGSTEAQILLLSKQIEKLFLHLKKNKKDLHSKRGLLAMVNDRKKLLQYLKKEDEKKYKEVIAKIGLKK